MICQFLRAKIHQATVSEADLSYVGSVTIPKTLCDQLILRQGEKVDVLNITNGNRITTYVIHGDQEEYFCINGAAAHMFSRGDKIIIVAYCALTENEIADHTAKVAIMESDNTTKEILDFTVG